MIVKTNQPLMPGAVLTPPRSRRPAMRRRGMGSAYDDSVSHYDVAANLRMQIQEYISGIGPRVEQGTDLTPDSVRGLLTSSATSDCAGASFGLPTARCAVPFDLIDSLVAQYAAAWIQKKTQFAAQVAAGQVTIPGGSSYVAPLAPAPAPVAPLPVTVKPVQSNAPAAQVAPAPTPAAAAQSNAAAPDVVVPGADQNWFTSDSMTGYGVPNWLPLVVAGGIGWFLFSKG